jgi:hypothetical protein
MGEHPFASVVGVDLRPDPIERAAQIGRVCGIAAVLPRSTHPLVAMLRQAERDDRVLARALDAVDALPPLTRHRLIARAQPRPRDDDVVVERGGRSNSSRP